MTKHKRTKRISQKGGILGFFETADQTAAVPNTSGVQEKSVISDTLNSISDTTKNIVAGTEGYLQQTKDKTSSWFSGLNLNPFSSSNEVTTTTTVGGKRRRRARTMKGGKGGLGLTYYASPVSGLKVAEPTTLQFYANGTNQYSIKGGSRKRRGRKTRRTRRHNKH